MHAVNRPDPPSGFRRVLWRMPIQLFRLRLDRLLGSRLLLLHHTGRTTGLPRTAVLEVVEHTGTSWTVASGFGPRAAWYRNILASPAVVIRIAGSEHAVTAVPLPPEVGAEVMVRYGRAHPQVATRLARFMGFGVDGSDADWREVGRLTPFVRFEERPGQSGNGQ